MSTHDFNVYETLAKLDGLLESGHETPSPMDRAEYRVLTSTLVRGAVELLGHLALHNVLTLETADTLEPIASRQISTTATDVDGGFTDEVVTIGLPVHLVPYGAIVESMKAWNVGTIETLADLCVLARLWARYLKADSNTDEERVVFAEWEKQADRVAQRCLPAVQQLDAAGVLGVRDLRTNKRYRPSVVDGEGIVDICSTTDADQPRSTGVKKSSKRKQNTPWTGRAT